MGSVLKRKDFEAARKLKGATLTELGVVPVCLAPGKEAFGHSHNLIEEVLVVHKGKGQIQIEDETCKVRAGTVAVIPAGQFHLLCNTGKKNLEATVIYNSNVNRERVKLKNRDEHFGAQEPTIGELCAEIARLKKAYKKLAKQRR